MKPHCLSIGVLAALLFVACADEASVRFVDDPVGAPPPMAVADASTPPSTHEPQGPTGPSAQRPEMPPIDCDHGYQMLAPCDATTGICERFDGGRLTPGWEMVNRYNRGLVTLESRPGYVGGHALRAHVSGLAPNEVASAYMRRSMNLPEANTYSGEVWARFWVQLDPPRSDSSTASRGHSFLSLHNAESRKLAEVQLSSTGRVGMQWAAGNTQWHQWTDQSVETGCWQCIELRLRAGHGPSVFVNGGAENVTSTEPVLASDISELRFGAVEAESDMSAVLDGLAVSSTRIGCGP